MEWTCLGFNSPTCGRDFPDPLLCEDLTWFEIHFDLRGRIEKFRWGVTAV
jgi:hypothetical protein